MNEQVLCDVVLIVVEWWIVVLCYFNFCGVYFLGLIGEDLVGIFNNLMFFIVQVVVGWWLLFKIFGDDYLMFDGIVICDYIYVEDFVGGYFVVLDWFDVFIELFWVWNLGMGWGSSVFEVLYVFEWVCGCLLLYQIVECCLGDVVVFYVDVICVIVELGW